MAFPVEKILLILCAAALGLGLSGAANAAGQSLALDETRNGGQVSLSPGQELTIKLPSSPGAGYSWGLCGQDIQPLRMEGEPGQLKGGSQTLGAPEYQLFRFKALEPGQVELKLQYKRPWEQKAPEKTFSVKVTVQ